MTPQAATRRGRRAGFRQVEGPPQGRGGRPGRRAGALRPAVRPRPAQVDETPSRVSGLRGRVVPRSDAISGTPGGAPYRAALRHRGRPLLAVSVASRAATGCKPPTAGSGRRAARSRRAGRAAAGAAAKVTTCSGPSSLTVTPILAAASRQAAPTSPHCASRCGNLPWSGNYRQGFPA